MMNEERGGGLEVEVRLYKYRWEKYFFDSEQFRRRDRFVAGAERAEEENMKKCRHCGAEDQELAEHCSKCGGSFSMEDSSLAMRRAVIEYPEEAVSSLVRWLLWLMAWGGVILVTVLIDPENLRSFLGFPVGFFGFLPPEMSILCAMVGGLFITVGGWIIYGMLSARILSSKTQAFWMYYIVLCVLLALNVGGCGLLIHTASGIH